MSFRIEKKPNIYHLLFITTIKYTADSLMNESRTESNSVNFMNVFPNNSTKNIVFIRYLYK